MRRPYQKKAIACVLRAMALGQRQGLIVCPTGVGKTRLAAWLASELNVPTIFLAHRDELIRQTAEAFAVCWPAARIGVIKAERNEWEGKDVVVASVQSMNPRRLEAIPRNRFGLVIGDEAHHAAAPTWTQALTYFDAGYRLGLSATPDRLDGKGLADLFGGEPVFSYSLRQAIQDGWLVRITQKAIVTESSLDGVTVRAGEFATKELADAVNTPERNHAICQAYLEAGAERRAIAFCVDIAHAFALSFAFQDFGVKAAAIDGGMNAEDRRDILAKFRAGKIQVLANCEILTEGFDDPGVSCVLMARPTKSRALYTQCVGRALRLHPGKTDALVLDITDNCRQHKLICALDLFGAKKRDADGNDVLAVAEFEEEEEKAKQEEILAVVGPVSWRLESVCPWPGLPTLDGYFPKARWQSDPASEKQVAMIRRFGLEIEGELTKGEAGWLIDQALAFEATYPTPATPKQEWLLRYLGGWEEGMTKKEAGKKIGELKKKEEAVSA